MASTVPRMPGTDRRIAHSRLSAAGWGLLFVWVGLALLLDVGWGYGLIGVGAIILGFEIAHMAIGAYRFDWFSTVCGLVFLLGGVWVLFSIQVGLVPILAIVAGIALLASAATSRRAQ